MTFITRGSMRLLCTACALVAVTCFAAVTTEPQPATDVDREIQRLIGQLGDPQYVVRERAQQELQRLGFAAFDALSEAADNDDLEVAAQARYLVDRIRVDWTRESDPPQVRKIFKDYELLETPQLRLARVKQLAELPLDMSLPWLCRVARFEQSQWVAKEAALVVISQDTPGDEVSWSNRQQAILKVLDRSQRPAVRWLRTYLKAHQRPAEALEDWIKLTQAEEQALEEHPDQSHYRLVTELLKQQVELAERLARPDAATAAMQKMVEIERGEPQTLGTLIQWLAKRKAWNVLDEVAKQFAGSFETEPLLLYAIAEARLSQGDRERAEQTADRALKLSGNKAIEHLQLGYTLAQRGLMKWSQAEYRMVLKLAPVTSAEALQARVWLSEGMHDRQQERDAAETLAPLIEAMDRDPKLEPIIERLLQGRTPASIRSRMLYFYACYELSLGHLDEHVALLDKAIGRDPSDVDVLIALFKLPYETPERRERTRQLVRRSADECRGFIDATPEDPDPYNQLAWLVANTEGDFDEAVRMSKKSIELRRSAGYLDTLGHCYYAKGDYANAAKYQAQAAKLDPHSQAIARQLAVFREALAAQKSGRK